jgi:hypothetical protein
MVKEPCYEENLGTTYEYVKFGIEALRTGSFGIRKWKPSYHFATYITKLLT